MFTDLPARTDIEHAFTRCGGDHTRLDAAMIAAGIRRALWTPGEIVEAYLQRIARQDAKLHAYIDVFADDARMAAEAAGRALRAGHAIGPLHGVPIAVKDLLDIAGRICTAGSMTRRQHRSMGTATVVHKLLAQGMILLGKTHTVEFAFGGWGTNQHLGTPWNPWDRQVHHTPGGSSSGSAVAVAGRLAPWAIGTDTGGSVRTPSAFTGLTGLKVTHGRISLHGIAPLSPSLDTPGVLCRSVADAATLFSVLQGEDPLDPATRGITPIDVLSGMHRGVRGLRLGRLPVADREEFSAEALAAYDAALEVLHGLGAQIVPVALPMKLSDYTAASAVMLGEAYALYGKLAGDADAPLDQAVRTRLLAGAMPVDRYLTALWARHSNARQFDNAMTGVDALLTPTTQTAAIPVASVDESTTPAVVTRFVNQLNLCGLAVPAGFTAGGLPLSLQIVGRSYDEALVLRIGQAYQQATQWHLREPAGL